MSRRSAIARGVLDTSTVILLPRISDAAALPSQPLISAVTLAELSVGPLVASDRRERAARQAHLQQAESDFDPFPFDADAARAFGRVAACLRRSGRKASARSYDAMIAATALANDLPLFTCNPDNFSGIDDLRVVCVPVPEATARICTPQWTQRGVQARERQTSEQSRPSPSDGPRVSRSWLPTRQIWAWLTSGYRHMFGSPGEGTEASAWSVPGAVG